jgi:hypothetical protein
MMVISISDMKRNSWKNLCRQCECVLKWTIVIFIRKDGSMVDVILLQGAKNYVFSKDDASFYGGVCMDI